MNAKPTRSQKEIVSRGMVSEAYDEDFTLHESVTSSPER
jgi:hypothetical protein